MARSNRKWEAWVMIASLVDRLKASEREGKRFRKKGNRKVKKGSRGREQRNEDGKRGQSKIHVERIPLLEQKYSSTSPCHLQPNESPVAGGRSMPTIKRAYEGSVENAPAISKSQGCIRKDRQPSSVLESPTVAGGILAQQSAEIIQDVPHHTLSSQNKALDTDHIKICQSISRKTAFGARASSESMSEYSTDSVRSSLGDELNKLNYLFESGSPFRTAAVLRDAVVGLGTLTRKIHQLFEADPIVANCPADVEMLVRRAGELYGSLQEFAENKGIPISPDVSKPRSKCQSNPELLFEDDAPWLDCRRASDATHKYAVSDAGCCQLETDGIYEASEELGAWEEIDSNRQVNQSSCPV